MDAVGLRENERKRLSFSASLLDIGELLGDETALLGLVAWGVGKSSESRWSSDGAGNTSNQSGAKHSGGSGEVLDDSRGRCPVESLATIHDSSG